MVTLNKCQGGGVGIEMAAGRGAVPVLRIVRN
jgi:hypothetical protein